VRAVIITTVDEFMVVKHLGFVATVMTIPANTAEAEPLRDGSTARRVLPSAAMTARPGRVRVGPRKQSTPPFCGAQTERVDGKAGSATHNPLNTWRFRAHRMDIGRSVQNLSKPHRRLVIGLRTHDEHPQPPRHQCHIQWYLE